MRRALLVLLALPVYVLAQTTPASGTVIPDSTDSTTINIAQCSGVQNTVRGGADHLSLTLNWTVVAKDQISVPVSGDKFRLYAANLQPAAGQGSGNTSCTLAASSTGGTFTSGQVGLDFDVSLADPSGGLTHLGENFAYSEIVARTGFTCNPATTSTPATVYLCVQWVDTNGGIKGWANGTLSLDLRTPASPPTGLQSSPGDGVLHVSASGGDALTTSCKAFATLGTTVVPSSEGSCNGLTITGLENNQAYSVVVYGLTDAKNPSDASAPLQGDSTTPVPTDDFWQHYHAVGGREQGGCGGAVGALALLGTLSLLAVRRRRKP